MNLFTEKSPFPVTRQTCIQKYKQALLHIVPSLAGTKIFTRLYRHMTRVEKEYIKM
jgi:hypothetical protein